MPAQANSTESSSMDLNHCHVNIALSIPSAAMCTRKRTTVTHTHTLSHRNRGDLPRFVAFMFSITALYEIIVNRYIPNNWLLLIHFFSVSSSFGGLCVCVCVCFSIVPVSFLYPLFDSASAFSSSFHFITNIILYAVETS